MRVTIHALFALALIFSLPTVAAELHIENARAPEAPPVAPVMAGYMDIINPGNKAITITGLSSKGFERVELHSMSMKDGMMHMEQMDKLTIPAGGRISLSPGGFHLMLIQPKKAFHAGDAISITLQLDDGNVIEFTMPVKNSHSHEHQH